MTFKLLKFDALLNELLQKRPLEENLSKIIRDIEDEFEFLTLGIFLKVPKSETYRLKIGRNLSHNFAKNTIFTESDPIITELMNFKLLDIHHPGRFKFEKNYSHLLVVPLNYKEHLLGFFFIDKKKGVFESEEMTKVCTFASIISIVVQIFRQNEEIEQHRGLYEITRVYSIKPFLDRAEIIFSMMARYKRDLSIAVMKIDNFENIIRTIGEHETSDLMKKIAYIIKNDLRETDLIGKLHNDTFVILMPETSEKNCLHSVNRVNIKIMDLPIMKVCKIGWGLVFKNGKIKNLDQLLKYAENAAFDSTRKTEGNITIYRE